MTTGGDRLADEPSALRGHYPGGATWFPRSQKSWGCIAIVLGLLAGATVGQAAAQVATQRGEMLAREGDVTHASSNTPPVPAIPPKPLQFFDRLRTFEHGRATIRFTDSSEFRMQELSNLQFLPSSSSNAPAVIQLQRGRAYFMSWERPLTVQIETPHGKTVAKGTEFVVEVNDQQTVVSLFDGAAELSNDQGSVDIQRNQQGIAEPGKPPELRASFAARNVMQWWLAYPGVIDPDELAWTADEATRLAPSLAAYRAGDLLAALRLLPGYPNLPPPSTTSERVYRAALLLSVGQPDPAEAILEPIPPDSALARALRGVIDAVNGDLITPRLIPTNSSSASELMALSYQHQARRDLAAARFTVRAAVARSTNFAFAWVRLAELEFSHGQTRAAETALARGLELAPRNAQAHALRGYLLAAQERPREALAAFDDAIRLDSSLGNAWLGRGLCKLRLSPGILSDRKADGGALADLQTAALLEPNRSLLRSYLGKAFFLTGDTAHAVRELGLARGLDPQDPTPWLYSAFANRDLNQLNQAIRDLETSAQLNTNRAVFRSRLLLDGDQAVRSSGLATIYAENGLADLSRREAVRAVSYDYANYSAHQFLAESFNELRDPTRFNLRYETPWFREYLLASLLAPVGAGPISQNISESEYTRFFDRNYVGMVSGTTYASDGTWRQVTSQFGREDRFAYALDLEYYSQAGNRPNNDGTRLEGWFRGKYQVSPDDEVLLLTKLQQSEGGDLYQYYDPADAQRNFRLESEQSPLAALGWHHQWSPGNHTLALGGWLESDTHSTDQQRTFDYALTNASGKVISLTSRSMAAWNYSSQFGAGFVEISQIATLGSHTLVFGGGIQSGGFQSADRLVPAFPASYTGLPDGDVITEPLERESIYLYDHWAIASRLRLTVGLAYDRLVTPENFLYSPLSEGDTTTDQLSPKLAMVWTPGSYCTVRGAYARALNGASFDESFRLEPALLAGFNQAYRAIIPEAEAGATVAAHHQVAGLATDWNLPHGLFLGIEGQILEAQAERTKGALSLPFPPAGGSTIGPATYKETLDYREDSLAVNCNQLLGDCYSLGASYRITRSQLSFDHPDFIGTAAMRHDYEETAILQQVAFALRYQHPGGLFAAAESQLFWQTNDGFSPARSDETLFQLNFSAGYRFQRQRAEFTVGVLNLTDADYRLSPLTPYSELARQRTFITQLRFRF